MSGADFDPAEAERYLNELETNEPEPDEQLEEEVKDAVRPTVLAEKAKVEAKEYKYTISYINGTPGLVVRGDHAIEMENAITSILPTFKRFKDAIGNGYAAKAGASPQVYEQPKICPVHNVPYVLKPAGVSKTTGKPYDAFWACSGRLQDGSYCRMTPDKAIKAGLAKP